MLKVNKFVFVVFILFHYFPFYLEKEIIDKTKIIEVCASEKFNGQIQRKLSNDRYVLESDNLKELFFKLNVIEYKSSSNKTKCVIVYIDADKHDFYIQDNEKTVEEIQDEINIEHDLTTDEIEINSMVVAMFEEQPYRARVQSFLNDDEVQVYFVDYGNTETCPKTSLKKCNEKLKEYPDQAKRCQLYNVSTSALDDAFTQLNDHLESEKTEISTINHQDNPLQVRLYVDGECFNEKFPVQSDNNEQHETISTDDNDQSSTTTATTIKEQDRIISATGKRNNDEIFSPNETLLSTTTSIKRQKSNSDTEGIKFIFFFS